MSRKDERLRKLLRRSLTTKPMALFASSDGISVRREVTAGVIFDERIALAIAEEKTAADGSSQATES